MTLGELETARRAGTPFVLCVFNNAASGYVKALQHSMFGAGNYQSSELVEMDYAAITRAMGCKGIRVEDPEKLRRRAARGTGKHLRPDRARHRGDARSGQDAARRRQPHAHGDEGRPAGVERRHVPRPLASSSRSLSPRAAHAADCPRPLPLRFEVTGKIVRSEVGFTQGLEWRDGKLFESTGAVGGRSGLNTIAPDGAVTNLLNQGTSVFGEGLTILNDEIFQLTWTDRVVYVFDLAGKLKRTMRNQREGWGLTNDGSEPDLQRRRAVILFRRSADLRDHARGEDQVRPAGRHAGLNELELVDGKLYGNIVPDPDHRAHRSGERLHRGERQHGLALALVHRRRQEAGDVARRTCSTGSRYDKASGLFYVTGKRWRTIFVGRFGETK